MATRSALKHEETQRLLEELERCNVLPLRVLFERAQVKLTPTAVRELASRTPVLLSDLKRANADVIGLALASRPGAEQNVVSSDEQLVSLLRIRAAKTKTRGHTLAKLRDELPQPQRPTFAKAADRRIADGRWPAGVGAIRGERSTWVFLIEHVQASNASLEHLAAAQVESAVPTSAASNNVVASAHVSGAAGDGFARVFERAFAELHDPHRSNLVELAPLRSRLATFGREEFDRGLRSLREADRYVLQTFDGRHGELTPEAEQAAIHEGGRVFVYVARRAP